MRLLEIAILCLTAAGLAAALFLRATSASNRGQNLKRLLGGLLLCIVAAHLYWEGAHWQMVPLYLACLLVELLLVVRTLTRVWRGVLWAAALVSVATTCCFSYVVPMFRLPPPTGMYAVGTQIVSMTDRSRAEDGERNGQGKRELVVQIWYPASASSNPRAPYRRRSETSLAGSYQSVDWTNSRLDAPVANGRFPILLYNPGWNGRRTQNTALVEELASHGYIVVATDHPYNSGPMALSDGRVLRPVASPELSDDVTPAEQVYAIIDKEVTKETTDTLFVLDQVEAMNENAASLFYHRLDLLKIGALGYSLGGAVAAEAAYRDRRIGAAIDLDTPLYAEAGRHGISQPFLLLCEDLPHTSDEELARMSFGQRRGVAMDQGDYERQLPLLQTPGSYQIALHGSLHTSFQDVILTSPLQRISGGGAIPAERMIQILRAYSVAFFDQSLRGVDSPLLNSGTSPFAEVSVLFHASPSTGRVAGTAQGK